MEMRNNCNKNLSKGREDLIDIRENLDECLNKAYERLNKQWLDDLDKVEYEVDNLELFQKPVNLPDCSNTEIMELKKLMKKEIKLLQILIKKKKCPISKIVDQI